MRRVVPTLVTALLLALASSGCATAPPGVEAGDEPTRIQVENFNSMTVVVEAFSSGREVRLGQVPTGARETFTLPRTLNRQDLRVVVDPIGATETWVSRELMLSDGDRVEVLVEGNLDLSTAAVF